MRTSDAIKHFGSQAELARALNIKPPSVADWGDEVPKLRQLQIERLTNGLLRADPSILPDAPAQQSAESLRREQLGLTLPELQIAIAFVSLAAVILTFVLAGH